MEVKSSTINCLYEFGSFCLDSQKRTLLRGGVPIALTPKVFDTLLVLVQNSGQPISRDELMQAVWPDSFVEEGNLTQNISVLRKALGSADRYIVTIPGRGYQFVERVFEIEAKEQATAEEAPSAPLAERHESRPSLHRSPTRALILLTLLVVATGTALLFYNGKSELGPRATLMPSANAAVHARRSLAVLGFRNLSGRADDQWLSTAFSEMLHTELAAGDQLRMISGEDVARARLESRLPDADSLAKPSLQRLHTQLNTDLVLLGSFTALREKDRERIRFDLRLQDTGSGEMIAETSATGNPNQLFQLATQVGTELRQKLGIAGLSSEQSGQVRASQAGKPQATRLYAQGLDALRRFDAQGARDLLLKAIAADPNHALSHSALAEAFFDLGYDPKAQQEARKAFELSANLSRPEQLLIEGTYRQYSHDYASAIETYKTLSNFFPDQLDYALYLANAQWKADRNKDALRTIARMRNLPEPQRSDPRIDLMEANVGDALGDFKLTQQMGEAATIKAQRQGSPLMLAQAKERQGWALEELGEYQKSSALLTEARDLFAASGNPRSSALLLLDLGDLAYDQGDLPKAREIYGRALQEFRRTGAQQKVAVLLSRLGSVATDQGDLQNGKRYEEQALRLDRDIGWPTARDLGNLAIVLNAMGDLSQAGQVNRASAQEYHQGGDKSNEAVVLADLADTLLKLGDIQGASGSVARSSAMLRATGDRRNMGYALFTSADILRAQDQLGEARKTAEQDVALRRHLGDRVNLPRSEVLLAQIELQQGKTAEAESLASTAAEVFRKQQMSDWEAVASACLSQALVRQGKLQPAQAAASQALALSRRGGDMEGRFEAELAGAAVATALNQTASARRTLEALLALASRYGYAGYALQAQLQLAELELKSKPTAGQDRLRGLQREARAKGFLLIARQAAAVLHGGTAAP
jgi:eukaryotic-like serine/threonine-protein kinase